MSSYIYIIMQYHFGMKRQFCADGISNLRRSRRLWPSEMSSCGRLWSSSSAVQSISSSSSFVFWTWGNRTVQGSRPEPLRPLMSRLQTSQRSGELTSFQALNGFCVHTCAQTYISKHSTAYLSRSLIGNVLSKAVKRTPTLPLYSRQGPTRI